MPDLTMWLYPYTIFLLFIVSYKYFCGYKNEQESIYFSGWKKIYLYRLSYALNQPISHSSPFSGRSFVFTLVYHDVRPPVKTSLNWNTSQLMYSVRTISLEKPYTHIYEINKITINFFFGQKIISSEHFIRQGSTCITLSVTQRILTTYY